MSFFLRTSSQCDSKSWSFCQYDSKNWTYLVFQYDSKNWTFLLILTQRSERFFEYDSKNWIFLNMTQKNRTFLFLEYDSKNWLFFNMIQRIEFLMTHKIEPPFWRRLKESNPFFWTQHQKLNFCLKIQKATFFFEKLEKSNHFQKKYDSKNWFFLFFFFFFPKMTQIFEFFHMTQRIEPLVMNLFSIWLKEMKFCFFHFDSKNWNPLFFSKCLKELNLSFIWAIFLHDSKNWLFSIWRKDFFKLTQKSWTHFFPWLKEMTLFLQNDAQNWTLILNVTQRMEPFFLWIRRKELNPFFFECDAEIWILFSLNTTQRIESFLFEYDAKNWKLCLKWLEELNRENCSKTWTFFFELDSKNRTLFFECDSKFENFWLKNSQNIELFPKNYDSKNWFFLKKNDAKFFFKKIWFEEWNLLENMTFKQKHDSKNWTLLTLTRRTDFLGLKELNFSSNMAQRIELLLFSMSQRMGVFLVWRKELNPFPIWLKELDPFLNLTRRIQPFFWPWLERIEPFFCLNMIQILEPSFEYDSKKWTFF